jgi:hypothetical protein
MASTFAGKYTGVADSGSRGAAPFTAVLVNVHGGGAATLYLNRTKAFTVTNPVTSGGDGRYTMFADPGVYDVVVAGFTTSVTVTPDAAEYAAGLPPGGTVGQIPAKLSSADGDVGWTANGGGSGQSVPLASQQAGIVDDATTYDDTIAANSGIEGSLARSPLSLSRPTCRRAPSRSPSREKRSLGCF